MASYPTCLLVISADGLLIAILWFWYVHRYLPYCHVLIPTGRLHFVSIGKMPSPCLLLLTPFCIHLYSHGGYTRLSLKAAQFVEGAVERSLVFSCQYHHSHLFSLAYLLSRSTVVVSLANKCSISLSPIALP